MPGDSRGIHLAPVITDPGQPARDTGVPSLALPGGDAVVGDLAQHNAAESVLCGVFEGRQLALEQQPARHQSRKRLGDINAGLRRIAIPFYQRLHDRFPEDLPDHRGILQRSSLCLWQGCQASLDRGGQAVREAGGHQAW